MKAHQGRSRLAACASVLTILGLVIAGGYISQPAPAQAAESVSIDSQSISCTQAFVSYSVVGSVPQDSAVITAFVGDTQIGSTTGYGTPDGSYSSTFAITPQELGTEIYVTVAVGSASVTGSTIACEDIWLGYTDGRLNPAPDEYYSVWCRADFAEIWITSNQEGAISRIAIADLNALAAANGSLTQNDITASRADDIITLTGANGNTAPTAGSKTFSLADCISRNGGVPSGSSVPAAPPAQNTSGSDNGTTGSNDTSVPVSPQCGTVELFISNMGGCLQALTVDTLHSLLMQLINLLTGLPFFPVAPSSS